MLIRKGDNDMAYYDDRLKELHKQKSQKQRLEAMKAELEQQLSATTKKVAELEMIKLKEQKDVEKMEGKSLTALIYQIAGNKEEKIAKERQEAYAATMKYETAKRDLEGIESDLNYCKDELQMLADCEAEYHTLFEQKKSDMKSNNNQKAREVFELEEQLAALEHEITELEEALDVGYRAIDTSDCIISELTEADNLANLDVFMDSMLVDLSKREHIESAQGLVGNLQTELRRFKTELADVQIQGNIQIEIDDFSMFADWFFDNIFTDWDIKEKIERSLEQAKETRKQIADTINLLKDMRDGRMVRRLEYQDRLEELVVEG